MATDEAMGFVSRVVTRQHTQRPSAAGTVGLSADDAVRRRAASWEAIENARLEGLPISEETKGIMDAHDRGEIDTVEMKRRVMMRHVRSS